MIEKHEEALAKSFGVTDDDSDKVKALLHRMALLYSVYSSAVKEEVATNRRLKRKLSTEKRLRKLREKELEEAADRISVLMESLTKN